MALSAWLFQGGAQAESIDLDKPRQATGHTSVSAARLLEMFDFEDRTYTGQLVGDAFPMPMGWYAMGRDALETDPNFVNQVLHQEMTDAVGFPEYTDVGFDGEHQSSGQYSLQLSLNGGSAGAYLRTGILPAVPESSYLVTADVMTAGTHQSAAYVKAQYVDADGEIIYQTQVWSDPIETHGRWQRVSVPLVPAPKDAAWMSLQMMLLQPEQQPGYLRDPDAIVLQDIRASAWFDNIGIWQLPHLEISTQSQSNIVRGPETPQWQISVRDLTGQQLYAKVKLYDYRRQVIAQTQRRVGEGIPARFRWSPELPSYGWYAVELLVYESEAQTQPIARTFNAMLYLPEYMAIADDSVLSRFSVFAMGLMDQDLEIVPEILNRTGLRSVAISAWQRETTLGNLVASQDRLSQHLEALSNVGAKAQLSLSPMPEELFTEVGVDSDEILSVLLTEPDRALPYLIPVLVRQGQQVDSWMLGSVKTSSSEEYSLGTDPMQSVRTQFEAYAPSPELLLPWSVFQAPDADLDEETGFVLNVPQSVRPEFLGEYFEPWKKHVFSPTLHFELASARELTHERRLADLALRMIHAWEQAPHRQAISQPWTDAAQRDNALLPDPALGVFTGVAHQLAGRRVIGDMPMPPGLKGKILASSDDGCIVVWNASAANETETVSMYLGTSPVMQDVWGNRTRLPLIDGKHQFTVGSMPVFIHGVDPELARFRAGFTIDDPMIISEQTLHRRAVTLSNPWPRTITGSLRFTGPEGWDVQPVRHQFSIPARGRITLPVAMRFPIHEVAGLKSLTAEVEIVADRRYVIDLSTPLELGLPDIHFDATLSIVESNDSERTQINPDAPKDVVVTCVITNLGDQNRSLYAFANLSGHPRQERVIARLEPGQTILRRFRFTEAEETLRQFPLRTGIRETDGPAVLNKRFDLGDAR